MAANRHGGESFCLLEKSFSRSLARSLSIHVHGRGAERGKREEKSRKRARQIGERQKGRKKRKGSKERKSESERDLDVRAIAAAELKKYRRAI